MIDLQRVYLLQEGAFPKVFSSFFPCCCWQLVSLQVPWDSRCCHNVSLCSSFPLCFVSTPNSFWGSAQFLVSDTFFSLDYRTLFLSTAIPLSSPVGLLEICFSGWITSFHWSTFIDLPLVLIQPSADSSKSGSWGQVLPAAHWSAWVRNRRLS